MTRQTTPPKRSIWAAGGVLYRWDGDLAEFLLVHRDRYDDWSIPKGKLNRGEPFLDAARREVFEETGFRGNSPRNIGTTGYETPRGNAKVVRWWLLRSKGGSFSSNNEVDRIKWLPYKKAMKQLSYEGERGVLSRGAAMVDDKHSGTIYLIRHAWAGIKTEWKKQDWQRPLDRHGVRQAKRIHLDLETTPLTRVVTSHYRRCVDTIRSLAVAHGIRIEKDKRLGVKGDADAALDLFREMRNESAAMSSHGEVIGDIIGKLAAEGTDLDGPMEWRKGSIWVLQTNKGRVKSGRYVRPA